MTLNSSRLQTSSSFRRPNSASIPTDQMTRKSRSRISATAVTGMPGIGLIDAPLPVSAGFRRESPYSNAGKPGMLAALDAYP